MYILIFLLILRIISAVCRPIWLPDGVRMDLICYSSATEEFTKLQEKDVDTLFGRGVVDFSLTVVWHNSIGNEAKIGEVFSIHLPKLGIDEYLSSDGNFYSNSQVDHVLNNFGLRTLTCSLISSGREMQADKPAFYESPTDKHYPSFSFDLHVYNMPTLIWVYQTSGKIPTKPFKEFCEKKKGKLYNKCIDAKYNLKVDSKYVTYVIPNLIYDYKNVFVNPYKGGLSKIHAEMKYDLHAGILNHTKKSVTTSIIAQCMPGRSYSSKLPKPTKISTKHDLKRELENNKNFEFICKPCKLGYGAVRSFNVNECVKCKKGFYRDSSWPASQGCLSCAPGYTTLLPGSTSEKDCVILSGKITRILTELGAIIAAELERAIVRFVKLYQKKFVTVHKEMHEHIYEAAKDRLSLQLIFAWFIYVAVVLCLYVAILYRIILIYKFKCSHSMKKRLLIRAIIVGQLNLIQKIIRFEAAFTKIEAEELLIHLKEGEHLTYADMLMDNRENEEILDAALKRCC